MSHHSHIVKILEKCRCGLTIKEISQKTDIDCKDIYYIVESNKHQGDFQRDESSGQTRYKLARE